MTLNQLRYLLVLCEQQSFTRAALRCSISQPSLTKAIKTLERELGGPLLVRKPQVQVSSFGRALLPHFKSIVQAADDAADIAAALACEGRTPKGHRRQVARRGKRLSPGSAESDRPPAGQASVRTDRAAV